MPEIAEVRTVAKTLNKRIIGKKITGIDFIYDKIILGDKEEFKDIVKNKTIKESDCLWSLCDFTFQK